MLSSSAFMSNSDGVLYVSGEESNAQLKMRIERLGLKSERLFLMNETSVEDIVQTVRDSMEDMKRNDGEINTAFKALVVDSIQTLVANEQSGAIGSC